MLRSLTSCTNGAAAVETALVVPLILAIMFGAFEAGNFFWNQHVVTKAVRDGARYAGRRPLTDYVGPNCVRTSVVQTDTEKVVRTGLRSAASILVEGAPNATTTGIYRNEMRACTVKVTATVIYTPILGILGFSTTGLTLKADAQAAVMGF